MSHTLPLATLLADSGVAAEIVGDDRVTVSSVVYDSRRVVHDSLFCCLVGTASDGHDYAEQAMAAGASALVVEHRLALDISQIVVANGRAAMGHLAASLHGFPSRRLTLVGVTGTNGKTTTTHLISAIINSSGAIARQIGTLTGAFTTPESPELQAQLDDFVNDGASHAVLEVSSHALALDRAAGCHFDAAVFTNLGRDHLDFHSSIDDYFAAKARLFAPDLADVAVINTDDPFGQRLADMTELPVVPFSIGDVDGVVVDGRMHRYRWKGVDVTVPLGGSFNVMNSLAAATTCHAVGLSPSHIAEGLAAVTPVPGRFEAIDVGQDFDVIVDFAHTPDGLQQALTAARSLVTERAARRVIVVFGCGGDRDAAKRPEMGEVAGKYADAVVVTSDNPRSEDPDAIINAIISGVPADYRTNVVIEPDRRQAITAALQSARSGDVVVIAGKGHERTQTVGSVKFEFDDRQVARDVLRATKGGAE